MPEHLADIQGKVKRAKDAASDLYRRMDDDRALYYLEDYILKDALDRKVDGIINMTLNTPATFAAHVQSGLMAASQQLAAIGDGLEDDFTHQVESILRAIFADADALLRARAEPSLRPNVTEQVVVRGRAAAQVLMRVQDGKLISDIRPLDARYFTFEKDQDGIKWGAYSTWRTPQEIEAEYPGKLGGGALSGVVPQEVVDFWSREENVVHTGVTAELKRQVNTYPRPPFVFEKVPLGTMLRDRGFLAHEGESIYFLIRKLLPEANRLASIMQTLNMATVKGARLWNSNLGIQAEVPEDVDVMGAMTAADNPNAAPLVPTGDLKAAGRQMQALLSQMIQAGSLSMTDLGNLNFPLSAVALIQLSEASGQVFLPRLGAMGLLFQQIAEMAIEQILAQSTTTLTFGTRGRKRSFKRAELAGDYDVEFSYTVKSPETDVARMSIAESARQFFDEDTILRDILMVPNPTEVRMKRRLDAAERISPNILLFRTAKALLAEGREVEAAILADELQISLEQLRTGEFQPPTEPAAEPMRNRPIPLLGTRAGSNRQAAQLRGEIGPAVGAEEEE